MDASRRDLMDRFGPLLADLDAQGYDTEQLLNDWARNPDDFSVLASMLLEPQGESLSLPELAERHGTNPDFLRQAWQCLGFVDQRVTTGDGPVVEMCETMRSLLGAQSAVQLLSVMGQTNRRLAEAEIAEVRLQREVPLRAEEGEFRSVDYADEIRMLTQAYVPMLTEANGLIHRRHLMITGAQTWGVDDDASTTLSDRLIGFTDLAGFTARSVAAGASELAHLIRGFEATVNQIVTAGHGRVVKLIGDEVMFSAESVDLGCAIALELRAAFDAQDLVSHSGLAFGAVLDQGGDYYGPVVNLAARLANRAEPGQILVGPAVSAAAQHRVVQLGTAEIRGFDQPIPHGALEA